MTKNLPALQTKNQEPKYKNQKLKTKNQADQNTDKNLFCPQ